MAVSRVEREGTYMIEHLIDHRISFSGPRLNLNICARPQSQGGQIRPVYFLLNHKILGCNF